MSKSDTIYTLAVDAGLPDAVTVDYHRSARRWFVVYPVALGDYAQDSGNRQTILADYGSVEDAHAELPTVAANFWERFGRVLTALEGDASGFTDNERQLIRWAARSPVSSVHVAERPSRLISEGVITAAPRLGGGHEYTLTNLGHRVLEANPDTFAQQDAGNDDIGQRYTPPDGEPVPAPQQDASRSPLHELLARVADGEPVPAPLLADARAQLERLEANTKTDAEHYTPQNPAQPRRAIPWEQPTNRKTPLYKHAFNCAVCGEPVTVENHSPNAPSVCDRQDCRTEHRRALTRERVRRYRQRKRQQDSD